MKKRNVLIILLLIISLTGCGEKENITKKDKNSVDPINSLEVSNQSNLVLNKYYVDADNENPKESLSQEEVWIPYLKFMDNNEVEINYTCYGEGMCQYKTNYESYFDDNVEYIKIYESDEMFFMCSERKGYALLKVDGNKLFIITSEENYAGLDMAGVREYILYEE